jgi:hypothetical protein
MHDIGYRPIQACCIISQLGRCNVAVVNSCCSSRAGCCLPTFLLSGALGEYRFGKAGFPTGLFSRSN